MKFTKLNTKFIATLGILGALSIVLALLIHFPIFPQAAFMEYDPADIPIFLTAFIYGPLAGLILTVVVSFIQGFTVSAGSGIIGIFMHIAATGTYVLVSGLIYKKMKTLKGALISMGAGSLAMVAVMVFWNIVFIPIFSGVPRAAVYGMLLTVIIPFNLIKVVVNSLLTFVLYKRTKKLIGFIWEKADKLKAQGKKQTPNIIETACAEETYAFAEKFASNLNGSEIILLDGELGAGKTAFTKGLARGLWIYEEVTSPTFILMSEYSGRLKLYHFDLYRINFADELEELGFNDYLYGGGVCVVEWNKFQALPEDKVIRIKIDNLGGDKRRFEILK